MKISYRKISASTEVVKIPAPLDDYFEIISDKELVEWTGYDDTSSDVEAVPGYQFHHLAWVKPKGEYDEMLADVGLGIVELAQEDEGEPLLVYAVNDRVYPVTQDDLELAGVYVSDEENEYIENLMDRDLSSSTDVNASNYYVTPEITDSDLDFAAKSAADYLKRRNLDTITTEDVIEELRSMSDVWDEYWAYGLRTKEDQKAFLNDFLNRLSAYGITDVVNNTFDEDIISVNSSVDTGLDYWYYTRHGIGPGMMPNDCQILDWYEEGYKTWIKLNKMLTTDELNYYDIQEQWPPVGAITHNGEEIQGCSNVTGSDNVSTFYKGINRGPRFYGDIERFQNMCYDGTFVDSYDLKTPLSGWCNCVGYSDDEEGHYWRAFSNENWEKIKNLSNEEIYAKYPPSPYYDELKSSCAAARIDIEGATLEEMQKAMEEYTSKADALGKQLDDLQDDVLKKSSSNKKPGLFSKFKKKSSTAASTVSKVDETDDNITYVISSEDTDVSAATDIDSIDLDALKKEIEEGCIDYLCGPQGGFKRPGEPREDKWDMYADEFFVVEVNREDDHIVVEVRAELGYSGMENMSILLDEIIRNYDEDAYFDMVEPGIMDAYIYGPESLNSSTDITAGKFDKYNDEVIRREEDRRLEPPEYPDYDNDRPDQVDSQFVFDIVATVDDDHMWSISEGDPLYHADILDDYGINEEEMLDNFNDLIEWNIPSDPGKYALKGKAKLVYDKDGEGNYSFASYASAITDLTTTNVGKVESSTVVEAAMSEEDLDHAILNDKPFDLESFKKWKNPVDPDAILAEQVQVGDVIDVEEDASEVNLGTVVEVLAINDPAESWIDYTFRCKVVVDPGGMQNIYEGALIDLHFAEGDPIGYLVEK